MKFRVSSSILFAMAVFGGGMAQADDLTEVNAELTFDKSKLATEAGAAEVLADLENQARTHCRKVSMVTVGLSVDEVCAKDMMVQAVDMIGNANLTAQYASSDYYVEGVSDRMQLAAR
ncbi:UrcA family protein [Henriciella aquimarina]|uniref:UrcA family protein n=1 Tax=Henriciella aquimarina TaxID=545261 RepID=UPI001301C321|nr:UrcA family protein [Henriciella aquimarina]